MAIVRGSQLYNLGSYSITFQALVFPTYIMGLKYKLRNNLKAKIIIITQTLMLKV